MMSKKRSPWSLTGGVRVDQEYLEAAADRDRSRVLPDQNLDRSRVLPDQTPDRSRVHPDRIQDRNPELRADVARLIRMAAELRIPAYVLVNNRAEGSAPHTIAAIARLLTSGTE